MKCQGVEIFRDQRRCVRCCALLGVEGRLCNLVADGGGQQVSKWVGAKGAGFREVVCCRWRWRGRLSERVWSWRASRVIRLSLWSSTLPVGGGMLCLRPGIGSPDLCLWRFNGSGQQVVKRAPCSAVGGCECYSLGLRRRRGL